MVMKFWLPVICKLYTIRYNSQEPFKDYNDEYNKKMENYGYLNCQEIWKWLLTALKTVGVAKYLEDTKPWILKASNQK